MCIYVVDSRWSYYFEVSMSTYLCRLDISNRCSPLTFSPQSVEVRGLWNEVAGRDCRLFRLAPSTRSTTSMAVVIGPSGCGNARLRSDGAIETRPRWSACSVCGGCPGGLSESPTLMTERYQHSSQIAAAVNCKQQRSKGIGIVRTYIDRSKHIR